MRLEIVRSQEWKELLAELATMQADYREQVISAARRNSAASASQAVSKLDGFTDAITFLKGLGGE